jgi:hypothetical protein
MVCTNRHKGKSNTSLRLKCPVSSLKGKARFGIFRKTSPFLYKEALQFQTE